MGKHYFWFSFFPAYHPHQKLLMDERREGGREGGRVSYYITGAVDLFLTERTTVTTAVGLGIYLSPLHWIAHDRLQDRLVRALQRKQESLTNTAKAALKSRQLNSL